jgi:iron complex outermembrane receptor protein
VRLQARKSLQLSFGTFMFFGGVNNLFDVTYFDNIRLNAFGSRYYEPAPGRNLFGGISFAF